MWVLCLALLLGHRCGTGLFPLVTELTEHRFARAQTLHTGKRLCRFLLSQQSDADVALVNQFLQFLRLCVAPLGGIPLFTGPGEITVFSSYYDD